MNVDQFNSMVSASLKRGNTLDSQIPQQTAMAVQWIERNYTFKYMEAFRLIVIQQNERVILMPVGSIIKSWIFFRIINTDGSYKYINKVEGKDLTMVNSSANTLIGGDIANTQTVFQIVPGNFFQVGLSTIVLDAVPSQNLNSEAMFYNYSSWPTDSTTIPGGGSSFTHPLLQIATDMLLAQTQILCAVNLLKDLRMMAAYKEVRDEAVSTLTRAEDETKFAGENIRMLYKPTYDDEQINAANTLGF
jgi:hypothetical protein